MILDVMMPEMDGLTACTKIREFSQVPIIMLTAKGEIEDRIIGLELGADDYLIKPFSPRELVARVRALCSAVPIRPTSPPSRYSTSAIWSSISRATRSWSRARKSI